MLYMVGLIQDGIQGILMVDAMFVCTGRPDDPHCLIVLQYWPYCKTISVGVLAAGILPACWYFPRLVCLPLCFRGWGTGGITNFDGPELLTLFDWNY